jgi:hypothetical protein
MTLIYNVMVIITNWLITKKYQFHKCHWIFSLLRIFVLSVTDNNFTGPNYEQHDGCFIRNRNCLTFVNTWVHMNCILLVFLCLMFFFFVFCLVANVACVSGLFIVPSVVSKVCLKKYIVYEIWTHLRFRTLLQYMTITFILSRLDFKTDWGW